MRPINEIIIHCTGTIPDDTTTVESIRHYHVTHNGWKDIGYHYVIYRDGSIHQGRPVDVQGAHCEGHNQRSIGICYVGGLDSNKKPKDTRTVAQMAALRQLVKSLKTVFPTISKVSGHNQYSSKACPCFNVQTQL